MPGESGSEIEPILTLEQEGLLLLVMGIGTAISIFGVTFLPEYVLYPHWLPPVLLAFWLVFFFQWAAKGGVPPHGRF